MSRRGRCPWAGDQVVDAMAVNQVVLTLMKKQESPGSPWRPARPRNWLSILRDSCRFVPRTSKPPRPITCSRSRSSLASQAYIGAPAGHVGRNRHCPRHTRLGNEGRFLLNRSGH